MLAYVLVACFVIPLLMLIVDVAVPRDKDAASRPAPLRAATPQAEVRPHVTAATDNRRSPHKVEDAPDPARAPRIAPGDGMVYRGSVRAR
jgi:hypothetical protein